MTKLNQSDKFQYNNPKLYILIYISQISRLEVQWCITTSDPSWENSSIIRDTRLQWVQHGQLFSRVQLFVAPLTVACQDPLSMGFPRQEYWSGLPFPSPGHLPDPRIKPTSPALEGEFFTTNATWDARGTPKQHVSNPKRLSVL